MHCIGMCKVYSLTSKHQLLNSDKLANNDQSTFNHIMVIMQIMAIILHTVIHKERCIKDRSMDNNCNFQESPAHCFVRSLQCTFNMWYDIDELDAFSWMGVFDYLDTCGWL